MRLLVTPKSDVFLCLVRFELDGLGLDGLRERAHDLVKNVASDGGRVLRCSVAHDRHRQLHVRIPGKIGLVTRRRAVMAYVPITIELCRYKAKRISYLSAVIQYAGRFH